MLNANGKKIEEALNLMFLICLQPLPVFTFANQAGLDMLETTFLALQDIALDKIFDESGQKMLCSEFAKIMQQVMQISSHFFFPFIVVIHEQKANIENAIHIHGNCLSLEFFFGCSCILHSNMSTGLEQIILN